MTEKGEPIKSTKYSGGSRVRVKRTWVFMGEAEKTEFGPVRAGRKREGPGGGGLRCLLQGQRPGGKDPGGGGHVRGFGGMDEKGRRRRHSGQGNAFYVRRSNDGKRQVAEVGSGRESREKEVG